MLPRPLRVTRAVDHRRVVRTGRRAGVGTLTLHLLAGPDAHIRGGEVPAPVRAGLVVGKPVGNAVARHRVSRRLRHLLAARLEQFEPGALVIVRARPGAAEPTADLAGDLDSAIRRLARGSGGPGGGAASRRRGTAERDHR